MTRNLFRTAWVVPGLALLMIPAARGDWPQWRGSNRDARVAGFTAPATWPKELSRKWTVKIGEGVATPALVGDRLYVFSREGNKEVVRALDAATGKDIWKDEYDSGGATGPASGFSGPRSSPTVADGKVVTLGVRGILSCYDAATGKRLWQKGEVANAWPNFFVSSSPIVMDGMVIAQVGGRGSGGIAAYDLASGTEKWSWTGDPPAYASPALTTVDGAKVVVAVTDRNLVAVGSADGKLLWKTDYATGGGGGPKGGFPKGGAPKGGTKGKGMGGRGYNASTPMVDGQTLIYSGSNRGTRAVKLEKSGNELEARPVWTNTELSVMFNTPVVKDGMVFGLTTQNELFCITKDGKTAWKSEIKGRGGYGSIVDAGSVMFALTPAGQLTVFEPTDKSFKELASYKVADSETYAYPVIAGSRIYIKDKDSVTLWSIE